MSDVRIWRVYFNKFSEAPLVWSIDNGEGTEEFKFRYVAITGLIYSNTEASNRGSQDKPCAWFEVKGELVITGM